MPRPRRKLKGRGINDIKFQNWVCELKYPVIEFWHPNDWKLLKDLFMEQRELIEKYRGSVKCYLEDEPWKPKYFREE